MPVPKNGKVYSTILDDDEDDAVQKIALDLVAQKLLHDKFGRAVKPVRGRVSNYSLARFALLQLTDGHRQETAQRENEEESIKTA